MCPAGGAAAASGAVPLNHLFELSGVGLSYGSNIALTSVSAVFRSGEFTAIAGPNGAGKSTMLKVMTGTLKPQRGACRFDGKDVGRWNRTQFARRVSVVPQSVSVEFAFTAEQVVLMGRTPFADSLFESRADAEEVRKAMELTGTLPFRHRDFRTLSGGEKQRVILASALAQTPEALLLDEPSTFLDLEHQVSLYSLLRSLARQGLLVLAITHDLNLASAYADRILLLRCGSVAADGAPEEVVRGEVLHDVFRVNVQVQAGPSGRPWIYYGA